MPCPFFFREPYYRTPEMNGKKCALQERFRVRLRMINEPVMNRVQRKLEPVGNSQLVKNIVQMVLDRLLGDEKFFANFLVSKTLCHQLNDFFLAVAQQRLFAPRSRFRRLRE